jgi:hypothetical protein
MECKLKQLEGQAPVVTGSAPEYGRVSVLNQVKDYIVRHPDEAFLISLATGFLLGRLLGGAQQRHWVAKNLDFYKVVNDTAELFERERGLRVTPQARDELIHLALPHRTRGARELQTGQISFEFLEQSLFAVLDNAREVVSTWGQNHINQDAVKESIKHYSPYFPWR